MNGHTLKSYIITFFIMVLVGILFNPMNILANQFNDLYLSLTLFYGGLLMASNMIWSHEIINYLLSNHFNTKVFFIGVILSMFSVYLLRNQVFVNYKQWLKRMIPHHSTAITTTSKLLQNHNNLKENPKVYRLGKGIIYNQLQEIIYMKSLLK